MRVPKFKEGDRVEVLFVEHYTDTETRRSYVGLCGTVENTCDTPFVVLDNGIRDCFCQIELEHEHLPNSPLFQELK